MRTPYYILYLLSFISLLLFSCKKDVGELRDNFRDKLIGTYKCVKVFSGLNELNGVYYMIINDSTAENITFKKSNTRGYIILSFNNNENAAINNNDTSFSTDGKTSRINGKFFSTNDSVIDSVYVYKYDGQTASTYYYGKKI